jgi:hypothetical protein
LQKSISLVVGIVVGAGFFKTSAMVADMTSCLA